MESNEKIRRLLRLDAALADLDGFDVPSNLRNAMNSLYDEVGAELDKAYPEFISFLEAQKSAVDSWPDEAKGRLFGSVGAGSGRD